MPSGLALKMNKDEEGTRTTITDLGFYQCEVFFYSSGIQADMPVASPTCYGVWTDGSDKDEYNVIMLEDMNERWTPYVGVVCM